MNRPKRVKKTVPPRDPRLVALAEQAQRARWMAVWFPDPEVGASWLRLWNPSNTVSVGVFQRPDRMRCIAAVTVTLGGSPLEALRAAYAQLGVALDQAEDAFGGTS